MPVLTTSPLRYVIRTDAIIAPPPFHAVALPAVTLPRTRLTLTDRPNMTRVVTSPEGRRIRRLREARDARPVAPPPVADCRAELAREARSGAWGALASALLMLAVVALCAACVLR